MKKIVFIILLFSIITLIGVILNTYLSLDENEIINISSFSNILLKSSIISLILTGILYFFNKDKIKNI